MQLQKIPRARADELRWKVRQALEKSKPPIEKSGMADHIWKEKGTIIDRDEHWRIR